MKKKNDGVKAVGRVSAVIAMVVLILAAIPVGACISLSRERNNVTAEYYGFRRRVRQFWTRSR